MSSQSSPRAQTRSQTTFSKHIKLSEFGRNAIQTWADANGFNFSESIELLALRGLEDKHAYAISALRITTTQGLKLVFNRFASLLSDIAIESATTRTMVDGIMLQLIRDTAHSLPDEFETAMRVRRGGQSGLDKRIRTFHDAIKQNAEQDAIRRMRNAVQRVEALFHEEDPCTTNE